MADEGWVIRIAFTAFLLLPVVAIAMVIKLRSRKALIAVGIWSWYFGWWFLQYAIESWTNPGGAGSFTIMLLVVVVGWALLVSEIRTHLGRSTTPSALSPIAD